MENIKVKFSRIFSSKSLSDLIQLLFLKKKNSLFWGFDLFLVIFDLAFPWNSILFLVLWNSVQAEHLRAVFLINTLSSMKFQK